MPDVSSKMDMNSWKIEWDLVIPKETATNLLRELISSTDGKANHKFKGIVSGNNFELTIKRSLLWGTAFRREVEGKGLVSDSNGGSHISAYFEICSPYKYVNLNGKNLSFIVPLFVLSWVGLIFSNAYADKLVVLNYIFVPAFFVTCFLLVIGFWKYLIIIDKFEAIKTLFQETFIKYLNNES
jgi:hypothetical protein